MRPDSKLRRALLGLVVVATSSSACTDFQDVTTVVDLRVLAVDTDPSEIFLKVDGLPDAVPATPAGLAALRAVTIDPASIPSIHLTPLLPDPPAAAAGGAVTWTLVGCPNNPYGAAPPGGGGGMAAASPGGGAYSTVGSSLCPDPNSPSRLDPTKPAAWTLSGTTPLAAGASLDVTLTPDELLQAFETDVFFDQHGSLHGGFDLGLPIDFQLSVSDGTPGTEPLQAIKRVVFWARQRPEQTVNQRPTIAGVTSFPDRDPDTWAPAGTQAPLDAATPNHVPLDKGTWLLPAAATAETYAPIVIDRNPPYEVEADTPIKEHIRYAFYATAGHFSPALTSSDLGPGVVLPAGVPPGTIHLESHFIPPPTLDAVPVDTTTGLHLVTVWIVVRDDRGGESWVHYQLAVDPPPPPTPSAP